MRARTRAHASTPLRRAVALTRAFPPPQVIVKASSGPRYVVGCRTKLDKAKLTQGTRVALDMTTLTIMRALPREARARRVRAQREAFATLRGFARARAAAR